MQNLSQDITIVRLTINFREVCVFFKAGKNCNEYFDLEDLLQQVENAIDIFEGKTHGFATGLFLFDNALSHQKWAKDAFSAHKMPKNPHMIQWHHKDGPKMQLTNFGSDNTPQDFYFAEDHPMTPGWFKEMESIIHEWRLWPEKGLNTQCEGFKCETEKADCCCCQLIFTQPDFMNQKSHLEELITS